MANDIVGKSLVNEKSANFGVEGTRAGIVLRIAIDGNLGGCLLSVEMAAELRNRILDACRAHIDIRRQDLAEATKSFTADQKLTSAMLDEGTRPSSRLAT